MQTCSSQLATDFSHKLYEQIRFDDVFKKYRLVWYVKISQQLVDRALIEKLWILVHATQILGILWINMLSSLRSDPVPLLFACFLP
jgi:hypothetical protein